MHWNSEFGNQADVINAAMDSFKKIIEGTEEVVLEIEAIDISSSNIDSQKNSTLEKI